MHGLWHNAEAEGGRLLRVLFLRVDTVSACSGRANRRRAALLVVGDNKPTTGIMRGPPGDGREWTVSSIRELTGRLDERRPAVDLADQLRLQRFWRGLILRDRFGIDVVEPLHQVRVTQRLLQRLGQLLNDVVRRALGRIDAVPGA